METLIAIVNIFFVPAISLYLSAYCLSGKQDTALTGKHFLQYCIFTAVNLPVTKIMLKAVSMVFGSAFSIASTYYTIIAAISAVILPCLAKLLEKSSQIHVELTRRQS